MKKIYVFFLILTGIVFVAIIAALFVESNGQSSSRYAQEIIAKCKDSNVSCMADTLADIAIANGTGKAFRIVKELYPHLESGTSCFYLANQIGRNVARKQPEYRLLKLEPESIYCNYGFYQSYAREFLLNSKDTVEAQSLCTYVNQSLRDVSSGAFEECYRGLGHALPFLPADIQGDPVAISLYALQACEELAPAGEVQGACISGLFSRIGFAERQGFYRLSVDTNNPLGLCRTQPEKYYSRCEGNLKRSLVDPTVSHDLATALKDFKAHYPLLNDDDMQSLTYTLSYDIAAAALPSPDFSRLAEVCLSQPREMQESCISGSAVGLAKNGVPGEQDRQVLEFCGSIAALKKEKSSTCPGETALLYMKGFFTPKKFASMCKEFELQTGSCDIK